MDTQSNPNIVISVPSHGFTSNSGRAFALAQAVRRNFNLSVEEWLICKFDEGLHISGIVRENDDVKCKLEVGGVKLDGTFGYDVEIHIVKVPATGCP